MGCVYITMLGTGPEEGLLEEPTEGDLPRDTLPCPPPPSSLAPISFDLTRPELDDDSW